MSTYTSYALSGIRNREILLAAIATMGLQAEVHEQAVGMRAFYGGKGRDAHIIIRRDQFAKIGCSSYLDIGFLENRDGSFTVQSDGHLPTMVPNPKKVAPGTVAQRGQEMVKFEDAVQTVYRRVNGDKAIRTVLTKTIPRLKALGKIPANATVKRQPMANGSTRVLVSY